MDFPPNFGVSETQGVLLEKVPHFPPLQHDRIQLLRNILKCDFQGHLVGINISVCWLDTVCLRYKNFTLVFALLCIYTRILLKIGEDISYWKSKE